MPQVPLLQEKAFLLRPDLEMTIDYYSLMYNGQNTFTIIFKAIWYFPHLLPFFSMIAWAVGQFYLYIAV